MIEAEENTIRHWAAFLQLLVLAEVALSNQPDDIKTVVEWQHEEVSCEVGDVVPHDVALEAGRWRNAGLVDNPAQPPDDLASHQGHVGSRQGHGSLGHNLSLKQGLLSLKTGTTAGVKQYDSYSDSYGQAWGILV